MKTESAKSFKALRVDGKARDVSQMVFRLSRSFPREEMSSLTDQICRTARSVGDEIAEAWGKCRFERHFVSKLTDAEQLETSHLVSEALNRGYLSPTDATRLTSDLEEI